MRSIVTNGIAIAVIGLAVGVGILFACSCRRGSSKAQGFFDGIEGGNRQNSGWEADINWVSNASLRLRLLARRQSSKPLSQTKTGSSCAIPPRGVRDHKLTCVYKAMYNN